MTAVRQALRGILRRPGAAAATLVTLALAIAANAAVGSVLYGLLMAPLPFPEPDRLVTLDAEIGGEEGKLSAREVRALQQDSRVFEGVAAFYPSQYNMTGDGTPESVVTMIGTSTLFPVLGARPVAGDVWPATLDWTTQSTVLLTHGLWQRRFGGDPAIVGRSILLDNGPYTVAGVLPDGFDYPAGTQLYRAVSGFTAPDVRRFTVVARLRSGMSMAAAQVELTQLAARLATESPETNRQTRFVVRPLRDAFVGRARPYLWLLTGAVGVALLLAVANVTNLRLARAIGMRGDLAVRAALGASRARLVAAVAVEGLLLVLAAGVAGVFLSAAALRLVSLAPLALPTWLGTGLAWPVVAALAVLLLCVGGLVSIVPGWLMTRGDQHAAIVEGSRRAAGHRTIGRWQQALVAVQVAVAVVLVAGAGLLARSLSALDAVDPGFQPDGLLTFRVDPPSRPYNTVEPIALFYRRASEALRALPGVSAVGHNDTLPFGGRPDTTRTMTVEGRDAAPGGADQAFVNTQIVSPAYFATMGVPLVRGRGFTADDRPGTVPVAVIGERTARRFWGDGDPIGQRVRTTQRMSGSGVAADTSVVYEVAGVVADVRTRALDAPPAFDLYVSAEQVFSGDTFFIVRTAGDPRALETAVSAAVRSVDPNQSLFDIRTMRDRLTAASWQTRTSVTVLSTLALVGLVVAAVGTYGVLAYAVALREREFGVRAALGADAAGLRRFVLREGLRPVGVGLVAGLVVTMGVGRSLRAVCSRWPRRIRPCWPRPYSRSVRRPSWRVWRRPGARHAPTRLWRCARTDRGGRGRVPARGGGLTMDTLFADIRLALRGMVRRPGLTLVVVLTLALGTGANAAIFSAVDGLLLRQPPFRAPHELVRITASRGDEAGGNLSTPELDDLRALPQIAAAAMYTDQGMYNASGFGTPEELQATITTHDLFDVLGVAPTLGSTFPAMLDRSRGFGLVISHGLWVRKFGRDPNVVGRTMTLDGAPGYTIHGVMPEGFNFPSHSDLFRSNGISPNPQYYADRAMRDRIVLARLAPGVGVGEARAALDVLARRLEREFPATQAGVRYDVTPIAEMYSGAVRPYVLLLVAAVALVLLTACVNVANVLLSRVLAEERQTAVRAALGATRWRIVRPQLVEAALYALAGGALGSGLAVGAARLFPSLVPVTLPPWMDVRVDMRALAVLMAAAFGTALVAAAVPALRAAATDPHGALKDGARGSSGAGHRLRSALVVAEVALALMLVSGASLMLQTVWRLYQVPLGFSTERALTFRVELGWAAYGFDKAVRFQREMIERLRGLPSVTAVTFDNNLPISGKPREPWALRARGQSDDEAAMNPFVHAHLVGPDYFAVMGIQVQRGRGFDDRDRQDGAPVVVVSARLAERLWPGRDPIGQQLHALDTTRPETWQTVVGVAAPTVQHELDGARGFDVYRPWTQVLTSGPYFVVRTAGDPMAIATQATALVGAIDANQSFLDVQTYDTRVANRIWQRRLAGVLFGTFAVLAVVLASIGLYGVMSYLVSQQTREMGVRLALGATTSGVVGLVLRRGITLALLGTAIGLVLSAVMGRFLTAMLFEVSATDLATFVAAPALLVAVAALASFWPARRASRVDPAVVLRGE